MADINDTSLTFFSKATPDQWFFILNLYREVFQLHAEKTRANRKNGPAELNKLDIWFQDQLPTIIRSRKDHQLFYDEIVQITKWKLLRGKFRPSLLDLVKTNTETAVKNVTKKAFKKMPNISSAISALTTLKGIGLSTASAILVAYSPEVCPYMADESMLSTPGVELTDYTSSEYMNYVEQIKICLEKLKKLDPDRNWTPHKIELALWTHYQIKQYDLSLLNKMPLFDITKNQEILINLKNNTNLEKDKDKEDTSQTNLNKKNDDLNQSNQSNQLTFNSIKNVNFYEDTSNLSSIVSSNSLNYEQSHDSLLNKVDEEENLFLNNINNKNGIKNCNSTSNSSLSLIYNNSNGNNNNNSNNFNLNSNENSFFGQSNSDGNFNSNDSLNIFNTSISSICNKSNNNKLSVETESNIISSFNKKKKARYCLNTENLNLDDNAVEYKSDSCEPLKKRRKLSD